QGWPHSEPPGFLVREPASQAGPQLSSSSPLRVVMRPHYTTGTEREAAMNTDLTILPAAIRALVDRFIAEAGVDFTDPAAVRGECDVWSRRLANALEGVEVPGYYDEEEQVALEVGLAQLWLDEVPAVLADDEMAPGHWVCRVTH